MIVDLLQGCVLENGALGKRFDASYKHHPVTESIYINRLANRPYRSTIKTSPATLPEPWTMVRGPRSKHIGPWSTDLGPRIVGLGFRGSWVYLLDLLRLKELN